MPKKETDYQLDIVKAVKAQGGYARKWSSDFSKGNPDIIMSYPGPGLILMEVKVFRVPDADNFAWYADGQKAVTPKQREELKRWAEAGAQTCLGLFVFEKIGLKRRFFTVWPRDQRKVTSAHIAQYKEDLALWKRGQTLDIAGHLVFQFGKRSENADRTDTGGKG